MCDPATAGLVISAVSAVAGGVSSYQQSQAQKDQAEYQAAVAEQNAIRQDMLAQQQVQAGAEEVDAHRREVAQVKGRQRSLLAAGNVDIAWGTPEQLQLDTAYYGEADAAMIRHNAELRAWQTRSGAANLRSEAEVQRSRADTFSPLVSGGTALASGAASTFRTAKTLKPGWFE